MIVVTHDADIAKRTRRTIRIVDGLIQSEGRRPPKRRDHLMRVWDQFLYAELRSEPGSRGRALTTLGITIGIAAIVALLSLANGFQAAINQQFEKGFSTNTLTVTAGGGGGFSFDGSSTTTSTLGSMSVMLT